MYKIDRKGGGERSKNRILGRTPGLDVRLRKFLDRALWLGQARRPGAAATCPTFNMCSI